MLQDIVGLLKIYFQNVENLSLIHANLSSKIEAIYALGYY